MLAAGNGMVAFFVIGIIGFVILMIVLGARHQKAIRENWANFARRHKLQYMGTTYGGMNGWYGSAQIRIHTLTRGSGKNRSTYTQFHATIGAPMPAGLVLYKEGLFSKLGKMVGGQDVQIGDAALDNAFIIKANDLLGTHKLLNVRQVREALLYAIARHPGMRIEGRTVMWEESGVVSKYERLEAGANDLSYLVGTFDAAHRELSGQTAASPSKPERQTTRRAAERAEIVAQPSLDIGAEAGEVDILAPPQASRTNGAQVRPAARDEDPATRAAFGEVAAAFHALEDKLASGARRPEPKPVNLDDAFEDAHLDPELEHAARSGSDALRHYNPLDAMAGTPEEADVSDAFTNPEAGDAFANPEPVEATPATPEAPQQAQAASFEGLIEQLADRKLMSRQREELIKSNAGHFWPLTLKAERVDRTFGFDLPDALRDGRTIEGEIDGREWKVAVRFPKARNAELDKLKAGQPLTVSAKVAAWDDLFKRVTVDAE